MKAYGLGMATAVIAGLALVVAVYGAWLSTRSDRRHRKREEEQRRSEIKISCGERSGFGGQRLVIGETVSAQHFLIIRVINDGEAPEYVHSITLESEHPSPLTVDVRKPEGTIEVRPRDQQTFEFALDGAQGFVWEAPFRVVVRLANEGVFYSPYGKLAYSPHHGQPMIVPDPDEVPDAELNYIEFPPGERVAIVHPSPSAEESD
jgi:hypothetical protein